MLDLGTLRIGVTADTDSAAASLRGIQRQTTDVETETTKSTGKMSSAWSTFKGVLGALGAGALIGKVTSSISDCATQAIESEDALHKFETTMSFAGYDDSTIQTAKASMKQYADDTVYDLNTISNTTAQLAANGVPDFEGLTEAAGNLNAVSGGTQDTFKTVAQVLTQTAGAGKLTTENWNQLSDAIPGASGVIQDQLMKDGAYVGNFRDAMEKGEITSDEFNQAIMELGNQPVAVEAAKSCETFEGAVGQMQAAVVDGLMQIIDAIGMDNITGFINGLSGAISAVIPIVVGLVSGFMDWLNSIEPIAPQIVAIVAAVGTFAAIVSIVNTVTTAITAFKTAQEASTIAQALLNAVMSANPFVLVAAAIAALVVGLVVLWNTNEDFRNAVIAAWDAISSTASAVWGAIVNFFTVDVPNAITTMITFFANLPSSIANFLAMVILAIAVWIVNLAASAVDAGTQFITNIVNFFSQLPGSIAGFLASAISSAASFVGEMASNAVSAGSQFLSNVISFISQVPGNVAGLLGDAIGQAMNFAGQMASAAVDAGSQFASNIISTLSGIPGEVYSIGCNIVQGIADGISGAAGAVFDAIAGVCGGAIDFAKGILGIASPSKVFKKIGGFTMAGFNEGIINSLGSVMKTMQVAGSAITGSFGVTTPNLTGSYEAYQNAKFDSGTSADTTGGYSNIVTVNNYSPKSLSERESAKEFKRSMRQLAFA